MAATGRLAGRGDPPVGVVDPDGTNAMRSILYTGDADPSGRTRTRTMARYWADHGVSVLIVNSQRRLRLRKSSMRQTCDLARPMPRHDGGGAIPVLLARFSFGADAAPFAYPAQHPAPRIRLVALISPIKRI